MSPKKDFSKQKSGQQTDSTADNDETPSADDAWVFRLIEEMERHSCIWMLNNPDHRISTVKDRAWGEIAQIILITTGISKTRKELETRWRTICRAWRSRQVRPTGSSAESLKKSKYDAALTFLHQRNDHADTVTNVPEPARLSSSAGAALVDRRPGSSASTAGGGELFHGGLANYDGGWPVDDENSSILPGTGAGASSTAAIAVTATTTSKKAAKRHRNDAADESLESIMMEEFKRSREQEQQSKSQNVQLGELVTQTLDKLPRSSIKDKISELMQWVTGCQCAIAVQGADDDGRDHDETARAIASNIAVTDHGADDDDIWEYDETASKESAYSFSE